MSNSNYWSELLFKLVSVPFLILVSLMVASQIVALHRYVSAQSPVLQQLALQQKLQIERHLGSFLS
ncbi:MAG: hypothetical protein AAF810_03035 [Cyanobacteria bacterium P01_D01_bin.36]